MYLVALMYTDIFIVKKYFNYFNLKYWIFVFLNWKSNTKIFWKLLCLPFDYVYRCDYVSNTGEEDSPHVKSYSGTPTTFPQHIYHSENWRISLDSFLKRKNVRWTKNWNSNLLRLLMEIHEQLPFQIINQTYGMCRRTSFWSSTLNFITGLRVKVSDIKNSHQH